VHGLVGLIVVAILFMTFAGFVLMRFGPPKDARRRQVKIAQAKAVRATKALRDVEDVLLKTVLVDDIVAMDMRQQCMQVITKHRDTELEIETK
jgi:hypothetical protein